MASRQELYEASDYAIDVDSGDPSSVAEIIYWLVSARWGAEKSERPNQTPSFFPANLRQGESSLHVFGSKLIQNIESLISLKAPKAKQVAVFYDSGVQGADWFKEVISLDKNQSTLAYDFIKVGAGEKSKDLALYGELMDKLSEKGLSRDDCILAIGGGVVGDLAGFIASTYLRGVNLVHLPTTVVAQVDSAIGGKTGVNIEAGKNLVGTFYPGGLVVSDVVTLSSLAEREFVSGLAEVVKYGLVFSEQFLSWLEKNAAKILSRDEETLREMIRFCGAKKIEVVSKDLEDKSGLRAKLNFGHTLGHAIEKIAGYGTFLHGEAISLGMLFALKHGVALGFTDPGILPRAEKLLSAFGLPTKCRADSWRSESEDLGAVWKTVLATDKKKSADGMVSFVVVKGAGDSFLHKQSASELFDSFSSYSEFWNKSGLNID